MELKVGDVYECPEGHNAKIVWIRDDKKVIAVKCPRRHLNKVEKIADDKKRFLPYRHRSTKEKEIYAENMVFLISI